MGEKSRGLRTYGHLEQKDNIPASVNIKHRDCRSCPYPGFDKVL